MPDRSVERDLFEGNMLESNADGMEKKAADYNIQGENSWDCWLSVVIATGKACLDSPVTLSNGLGYDLAAVCLIRQSGSAGRTEKRRMMWM